MKYLELGFMSHEKLVCNRFHEPRKLHSEISGVVKMRNDNLDFMGREYAFKYVPCWAMKPYTLISWAMKILKISFLDRITPWNVWKYCITLSDCYIKPQNLWPCCTMMDTLCFTTAIFSQRMMHRQFPQTTDKKSTKAVIYELYRPSKPLDYRQWLCTCKNQCL